MRRVYLPFFLGCFLLFLLGCAKPPAHIAVPMEVPPALASSDVVIVIPQQQMAANVEPSDFGTSDLGLMIGGVGPSLYDLAVETTRSAVGEENIVPIHEALVEYDVGARMKQALLPELRTISWLHVKQVEALHDIHSDVAGRLLAQGATDALVLIKFSYKLTSDFSVIGTHAELNIYPRSSKLKALTPPQEGMDDSLIPFYMKTAKRWYPLPDNPQDQEIAAEQWTRNNGELIKRAMDETIESVCDQLLDGLRNPYR